LHRESGSISSTGCSRRWESRTRHGIRGCLTACRTQEGDSTFARGPRGIITASGAQGQWIFVVPNAELVVVVTGESDANFLSGPDLLYRQVLPAVAGA
jgi:hypothetical protein